MITPPSPDARLTPEQIEERLARQRRELADDVDALAERVAPQARARAAGEELSAKAHETARNNSIFLTNFKYFIP